MTQRIENTLYSLFKFIQNGKNHTEKMHFEGLHFAGSLSLPLFNESIWDMSKCLNSWLPVHVVCLITTSIYE